MITLAKDGSLHARRQAMSYIHDKELVHALFEQVTIRTRNEKLIYFHVFGQWKHSHVLEGWPDMRHPASMSTSNAHTRQTRTKA
jgi:hypothetical protein